MKFDLTSVLLGMGVAVQSIGQPQGDEAPVENESGFLARYGSLFQSGHTVVATCHGDDQVYVLGASAQEAWQGLEKIAAESETDWIEIRRASSLPNEVWSQIKAKNNEQIKVHYLTLVAA